VKCERVREAASARLDGETIGMPAAVLDHHLATCPGCAHWVEQATRLSRVARVTAADVPDLSDKLLLDVVAPARKLLRRRWALRAALVVVGLIQIGIAIPSLFGGSIDMAMSTHAAHETAAWNIALGGAFLATATKAGRAAGLLPVLTIFVTVLAALSIRDVASGAVSIGRLSTHLGILVGLGLVFGLSRVEHGLPPSRARAAGQDDEGRADLRGVA
jgi:predicted anti-sigma-YlaC factor YlaD